MAGGADHVGSRATEETHKSLPTLQVGDTVNEQIAYSAYAAPDGERDNIACLLELIMNLIKGNQLEGVRSLEEGSRMPGSGYGEAQGGEIQSELPNSSWKVVEEGRRAGSAARRKWNAKLFF